MSPAGQEKQTALQEVIHVVVCPKVVVAVQPWPPEPRRESKWWLLTQHQTAVGEGVGGALRDWEEVRIQPTPVSRKGRKLSNSCCSPSGTVSGWEGGGGTLKITPFLCQLA